MPASAPGADQAATSLSVSSANRSRQSGPAPTRSGVAEKSDSPLAASFWNSTTTAGR
ncbi:hypothetical protein [Streptomyces violaceus]|uniref:Uncharacterized protein n=1 Tax=Streptomyces violaceus TaxID=1936 RepID=A0ABZ1NWG7_STRVL